MENKDIVSLIEDRFNIKLHNYDRILLEKLAKREEVYLLMPPRIGRSFLLNHLVEIVKYL